MTAGVRARRPGQTDAIRRRGARTASFVAPRHLAAGALVLVLTAAGFVAARTLIERDARGDSEQRVEIAAAQIQGRLEQATELTYSLGAFMLDEGPDGVTNDEFARTALRWVLPAGIQSAAWAEVVRTGDRARYERHLGQAIVKPGAPREPAPRASVYLPATLVSAFPPLNARGLDLRHEPGIAPALASAIRPGGVGATPIAARRNGASGLFIVAPAPNLVDGALRPGFVALFVSETTLRAAARNAPGLRVRTAANGGSGTVHEEFTVAGRRFSVSIPNASPSGPSALLPWLILVGGVVVAALTASLGPNAARRAKAQADLDRLFTLSSDLIAVQDFDGRFTRVNPAAEGILAYSEDELLGRRSIDFVHPDDRATTTAEIAKLGAGVTTLSFENRYVRKDGSERVLEWTATPVVQDGLMYGVARDVTERRQTEREQDALRRVATLVAEGVPAAEILSAVAEEVAALVGVEAAAVVRFEADSSVVVASVNEPGFPVGSRWPHDGPSLNVEILETGKPARIDNYWALSGEIAAASRSAGSNSAVGVPISVDGRLWGMIAVGNRRDALPLETEARLVAFTEIVATAVSNAQATDDLRRLADEQAALRRVATLVARGASPQDVFTAVAEEVGRLLPVGSAAMGRFEPGDTVLTVSAWSTDEVAFAAGRRWPTEGKNVTGIVYRTGRSARLDDFSDASGAIGIQAQRAGYRSVVGSPITVEGRLWGVMTAASTAEEPLPADTEARLASFTELVATAIANAESRDSIERLAQEQAALRQVAMLVAQQPSPDEVFTAVTEAVGPLLGADLAAMHVFRGDGAATAIAGWSEGGPMLPIGTQLPLDGDSAVARIFHTGAAARIDTYADVEGETAARARGLRLRSTVGAPILVEGRLWGALMAATRGEEPLPDDAETRIAAFTELVATAVSNAHARQEVYTLAEEQAALRRMATLVARGVPPADIFSAVSEEAGRLVGSDTAAVVKFEHDPPAIVVVGVGQRIPGIPIGTRSELDDGLASTQVYRTGRSSRIDTRDWASVGGPLHEPGRRAGLSSTVASPISVEGRLWGTLSVSAKAPLPPDTEERLEKFTEIVATAIVNAQSRSELAASRARVVAAADETRRQVERDLHDGVQQRLVSLALKARKAAASDSSPAVASAFSEFAGEIDSSIDDVREIARGIHPPILSEAGLEYALRALARRSAAPVALELDFQASPSEPVGVAAYYIVSEALTNVAKHAAASAVDVRVESRDGRLSLEIRDDGVGGADPRGSGLLGLKDRVEALNGTISLVSPAGEGTTLRVQLPADAPQTVGSD